MELQLFKATKPISPDAACVVIVTKLNITKHLYKPEQQNYNMSFQHRSFVEFKVSVGLLHVGLVTLLKVLWEYDISVLPNCMHSCFLTYSRNLYKPNHLQQLLKTQFL